jgi:polar amino acid transport system substrate-binding protein
LRALGIISVLFSIAPNHAMAEELSMGWEDWQPYQYKDSNQIVTGLDIELMQAIFGNINQQITLFELPWKRHLNNVESGRTDIAASASKTPEREQYAFFSDPYRTESAVMYIRKADASKYAFDSLRGIIGTDFKLAVTRGYYYGEEFAELMNDPEFKKHVQEVNDNQLAQRQLVRNRVDGFLEDPIAATIELRVEGLLDKVSNHMPIYSDDIYAMFSKKSTSPDLVDAFNKSLAELRANGTYDRIMDKYLTA